MTIDTVIASPKEGVLPSFASGEADLLLIHGGDETFDLQAQGLSAPLRVWGFNEHAIVGPSTDPANVANAKDGSEAMRRIAASGATFIDFRDPGSHTITQRLLRSAHLRPDAAWLRLDTAETPQAILKEASRQQAYVVVGHIPVAFGKLTGDGMQVLLKGDPNMRRAYVVVEPGPHHPASAAARKAAKRFADYLVSSAGQAALIAANRITNGPWIYPLPTQTIHTPQH